MATLVAAVGATAAAQTPSTPSAVATPSGIDALTPAVLAQYSAVLAAESLQVRDIPSAQLEHTARYAAEEFRRLGLTPGGDNSGWVQRVPLPGQLRLDSAQSQVLFIAYLTREGREVRSEAGEQLWKLFTTALGSTVHLLPSSEGVLPGGEDGPLLVAGRHTLASIREANIGKQVVLYVPPSGEEATARQRLLAALRAATPWLMVVDARDTVESAAARRSVGPLTSRVHVVDPYLAERAQRRGVGWALGVRDSLAAAFLTAVGRELGSARGATVPLIERLPARIVFDAKSVPTDSTAPTVPNVVGVLEGSDPKLRGQCLLVTARMDGPQGAANVAGLFALARAFRQSAASLRRSVMFAAVTGGADQWGSHFFMYNRGSGPKLVAHLSADVAGPASSDSVTLYGAPDVEGVSPIVWMTGRAGHGVAVADGGTAFRPALESFPFVNSGIPSLTLVGRATDDKVEQKKSERFDPAWGAQVLRVAYYLGEMLGNAERALAWSSAGRRYLTSTPTP